MGSQMVVVLPPGYDVGMGVFKGQEPVHIQALIPKAAGKRFDERVVRGLAEPGEVQHHPVVVSPLVQADGDELGAVVSLDSTR